MYIIIDSSSVNSSFIIIIQLGDPKLLSRLRQAAHAYLIFWHPSFLLESLNESSHLLHWDYFGSLQLRTPRLGLEQRIKQAEVEPALGVAAVTKRISEATLVL